MSKPELKYLDQRTSQRNIKQGVVKEEEYNAFLKSLPDESANSEEVPFEDENAFIDEDDTDDSEETMKIE